MSPVVNRVRSSSVTAAIKTITTSNPITTTSSSANREGQQIYSSASATGLVSYSLSSTSMSTSSSISGNLNNLNSEEMLDTAIVATPSSPCSSTQPITYDINWNDVNQLELDFVVYKTLPNIRKQLSPNEVIIIFIKSNLIYICHGVMCLFPIDS